jgi:hypothetical protein
MLGASTEEGKQWLSQPKNSFLPLVRTSFTANAGSLKPTWLMLDSIEDIGVQTQEFETRLFTRPQTPSVSPPKTESFVLRFSATGEPLAQGTYELEHYSAGRIQLFLVPSGASSYTAVFNHLVEPLPPNYSIPRNRKSQPAAPAATGNRPEQQQ